MNREKYIQMRKSGQYDLAWFYEYYLEKKGEYRTYDFNTFAQEFSLYFRMNGKSVVEYLDKIMEVQKIEDQQGNLLYIN